jgi:molybdenum cofactor guanylyltransferase
MASLPFNGAVLAGGMSTRMGQDKSSLRLDGQTLLERARQLLHSLGAEEVFAMRQGEVHDIYPDSGPLGGIHGAIHHAPNKPLLIIPVDLPLLGLEDLRALLKAGCDGDKITHFSDQYLPIFLRHPAHCLPALQQQLKARKTLSLRHFFQEIPCQQITPIGNNSLANANTPAQWQAIKDIHEYERQGRGNASS